MKLTPMKAIKAKCIDCIVDPIDKGTHIQQIENCTDTTCALHEHRPLTHRTKTFIKEKRIEAMSDIERQAYYNKAEIVRKRFMKNRDAS